MDKEKIEKVRNFLKIIIGFYGDEDVQVPQHWIKGFQNLQEVFEELIRENEELQKDNQRLEDLVHSIQMYRMLGGE